MKVVRNHGFALLETILAISVATVALIGSSIYMAHQVEQSRYEDAGVTLASISFYIHQFANEPGALSSGKKSSVDKDLRELKNAKTCPSVGLRPDPWKGLNCNTTFLINNSVSITKWMVEEKTSGDLEVVIDYKHKHPNLLSDEFAIASIRTGVAEGLKNYGHNINQKNIDLEVTSGKIVFKNGIQSYVSTDKGSDFEQSVKLCWKSATKTKVCLQGESDGSSVSIVDKSTGDKRNLKAKYVITPKNSGSGEFASVSSSLVRDGDRIVKPDCPAGLQASIALSLASFGTGVSSVKPSDNDFNPGIKSGAGAVDSGVGLGWKTEISGGKPQWKINVVVPAGYTKSDVLALAQVWCES